jgi:hypothetical protein
MNKYHEEDLKIFKNKDIEYYTFILTCWMSSRLIQNDPVTIVELYQVVEHAEERSQDCYVYLSGHHIPLPLDKLRDSADAAVLVVEDLIWRKSNLNLGQFCSNGFDREGFNREGRSVIPFAARFILQQKAKQIEEYKKALEKAFEASQ